MHGKQYNFLFSDGEMLLALRYDARGNAWNILPLNYVTL